MDYSQHPLTYNASFTGLIGVAEEDITPPVGIYSRNWGAARHDTARGIHRPLTLTCATFRTSEQEAPLVLISADLGWWKSADDEKTLRHGILEGLKLDSSRLMFCLSHTHAGPSLFTEDAGKPGGEYIAPYLQQIKEKTIATVQKALYSATLSTLSWRYGKCDMAVNRDLPDPEKDRYLVGFHPECAADDTLLVGRITDARGTITCTIVNYACHPTTLAWDNQLISPDYIGSMRELLATHTYAPCLFLQGASGELSPPEQFTGDIALADAYGRQLGYSVLAVLEAMYPANTQLAYSHAVESGAPVAIWEKRQRPSSRKLSVVLMEVSILLKPLPTLDEIERQWESTSDRVQKERLWRLRGVRKTVGDGTSSLMPLWIWRLGDSCLVGQPNEAYSWFQQQLRRHLAPFPVAVMNIVNGHAGYLPPRNLFANNMYSVWQTPFSPGGLEALTKAALSGAEQIMQD